MNKVVSFEIISLETGKHLVSGTRDMDSDTPNETILQEQSKRLGFDPKDVQFTIKSEHIGYKLKVGPRGRSMWMEKE